MCVQRVEIFMAEWVALEQNWLFGKRYFDANITYARALSTSRLITQEDFKDDEAVYFNLNLKFLVKITAKINFSTLNGTFCKS